MILVIKSIIAFCYPNEIWMKCIRVYILTILITNLYGIPHVSKTPHRSSWLWVNPRVIEAPWGCSLLDKLSGYRAVSKKWEIHKENVCNTRDTWGGGSISLAWLLAVLPREWGGNSNLSDSRNFCWEVAGVNIFFETIFLLVPGESKISSYTNFFLDSTQVICRLPIASIPKMLSELVQTNRSRPTDSRTSHFKQSPVYLDIFWPVLLSTLAHSSRVNFPSLSVSADLKASSKSNVCFFSLDLRA